MYGQKIDFLYYLYLVVSPLAAENLEGKLVWNQPGYAAVLVDGKGYQE